MTYKITRTIPAKSRWLDEDYDTLADARVFLSEIRQSFADDAPHGMECERAHWSSDCMSIICEETNANDPQGRGDKYVYTIFKT